MGDEEQRYTLAEAERVFAARECVLHGHDVERIERADGEPVGLECARCGRAWEVRPRGER